MSLRSTFAFPSPSVNHLSLFCRLRAHGTTIATNMRMRRTPPTTPPTTGARGNLLPPSFGPACIWAVWEDGPADNVEEVEEVGSVVAGGRLDWVEDWGAKCQSGQHGYGGVCVFTEESIGVVESIIVDLFEHDADVALGRGGLRTVRGGEKRESLERDTWLW